MLTNHAVSIRKKKNYNNYNNNYLYYHFLIFSFYIIKPKKGGMLDSEIANKFPQQTSFYTDQGNNYQQPYHDVSFNVVNSEASF